MKPPAPAPLDAWVDDSEPPAESRELLTAYLETAAQLGRDTAAMHRALAAGAGPAMAPEPFNKLYQRSVYQGMRTRTGMVFRELARRLADLPGGAAGMGRALLPLEGELTHRHRGVLRPEMNGQRTRVHGNYHLGELLFTGSGFAVIDFEGDPERPLSERRLKRSPLRDVADMVRSIHYAALTPLFGADDGRGHFAGVVREEDRPELLGWARFWSSWVATAFVRAYLAAMGDSNLLPADPGARRELLELFVLDKAVSELGGELGRRPGNAAVPLLGLLDALGGGAAVGTTGGGPA